MTGQDPEKAAGNCKYWIVQWRIAATYILFFTLNYVIITRYIVKTTHFLEVTRYVAKTIIVHDVYKISLYPLIYDRKLI